MNSRRRLTRSVLATTLGMGVLAAVGLTAGTPPAAADTGFVTYSCTPGGNASGDFTGSIPATLSAGTQFNVSGYQVTVDLTQAQVQAIEMAYGTYTLSGSVSATVDAVGATPSSVTQVVGTFSVPLPNPPNTGVQYSAPSTPRTLGPFTATSSHVVLTMGDAALDYSNLGVNAQCTPPSPAPVLASTMATGPFTLVGNNGDGTVSVLDTATGAVVGSPITVGGTPDYIALSPDGSQAFVTTWPASSDLVPIDTATLTAGTPIPIQSPRGIAITPDGQTAWVAGGSSDDTLYPVSMATHKLGQPVVVDPSDSAASVAITPDGQTAYVVSQFSGLIPVDLANESVGTTISLPGSFPAEVAINPDGTAAYVTTSSGLVPIDLTQNPPVVGTPIALCGGSPDRLALTPDGGTAYVGCFNSGAVVPVDLSSDTAGTPITIGGGSDTIIGVGMSPDGTTVYAADSTTDSVVPITTATNTAGSPVTVGSSPAGIGIMPDVGPAASLSVSEDQSDSTGLTEDFDAGASVSNTSPITSYAWNFGDGGTDVTTVATDTHTYAVSGSYTATVTETDGAGTSTTIVSTGQEILRDGSNAATATAQFTLSSCNVTCTPTVTSPDGTATVSVTQAQSTAGNLTLSVAPAILGCADGYDKPAEVSTLTESSAYSSATAIQIQIAQSDLASVKGAKICYQSGGDVPPAPIFLKKCSHAVPAPCYVSLAKSGTDAVQATLDVPPGDPRFWLDCGGLTLTKFSPTSGHVGQTVSIKGKNLSQVSGVLFSGAVPGTYVKSNSVTLGSTTKVSTVVPSGAATGPIEVDTPLGVEISTKPFTIKG